MAENNTANQTNTSSQPVQQSVNGQLYTWTPVVSPSTTVTDNTLQIPGHAKQEREPQSDQKPGREKGDTVDVVKPQNKEEEKDAPMGDSVDDLKHTITEQRKTMKEWESRMKSLEEDNVIRKQNEKRYQMAAKVAKYSQHFKSKDSFDKEVETLVRYSQVMNEEELEEHLEKKFADMQIKPRSAAIIAQPNQGIMHQVPDVQANNASSSSSDNNRKINEVMDMLKIGGV